MQSSLFLLFLLVCFCYSVLLVLLKLFTMYIPSGCFSCICSVVYHCQFTLVHCYIFIIVLLRVVLLFVVVWLSTLCISSGCFSCVHAVVCHYSRTVAYCLRELRNSLLGCECCGGFKGRFKR